MSASNKLRPLRDEITDLPNLITLLRIGLIPFVLVWIDNYSPGSSALACVFFMVAAASDALGSSPSRGAARTRAFSTLCPLARRSIPSMASRPPRGVSRTATASPPAVTDHGRVRRQHGNQLR